MAKAYHCSRSPRLNCSLFRLPVVQSRLPLPIPAAPRPTIAGLPRACLLLIGTLSRKPIGSGPPWPDTIEL